MPAPPGLGFGLTYYTVHYTVFTSHGGPKPDGSQTFPGTICRTGGVRPSRNDYGARERLVFVAVPVAEVRNGHMPVLSVYPHHNLLGTGVKKPTRSRLR